jgi:hypothetical protein
MYTGLRVLSTADVAVIEMSPFEVVEVIERACLALAAGTSASPRKLTVKPGDGHSVAYAMLGRDGVRDVVATIPTVTSKSCPTCPPRRPTLMWCSPSPEPARPLPLRPTGSNPARYACSSATAWRPAPCGRPIT